MSHRTQLPPKQIVNLAVTQPFQNFVVEIEPLLIPEKILDKRLNETLGHYEYLVKFERTSKLYNAWLSPKSIRRPTLIEQFERKQVSEITAKQHAVSWYPFDEQFAVKWKEQPFFVVSYGGRQTNKFCIVRLDKTGTKLKCKTAKHPHNPRHKIHLNMITSLMKSHELVIHNQTIMTVQEAAATPIISTMQSIPTFPKPLSTSKVTIFPSKDLQDQLVKHVHDLAAIPMEFKPLSYPDHCQCTLPEGGYGSYKSVPETMPGNKSCKVWLLHGPPLLGRKVFYWRCMQNNPACDIFYDGAKDGFLVYSSATVVSHLVPIDFIFQLTTGKGASFAGAVAQKELMNELIFGVQEKPLYLQKNNFIVVCFNSCIQD